MRKKTHERTRKKAEIEAMKETHKKHIKKGKGGV